MAKKVVSVAIQKKKKKIKKPIIIKHVIRRKNDVKILINKIINYMKSNTYMFAPLLYPHLPSTSASSSSLGEIWCEPLLKKKEKKSINLEDYLKYDCYMYAPALISLPPNPTPIIGKGDMGSNVSHHQITKEDENNYIISNYNRSSKVIDDDDDDDKIDEDDTFTRTTTPLVVRRYSKLLQKETIKRVVR